MRTHAHAHAQHVCMHINMRTHAHAHARARARARVNACVHLVRHAVFDPHGCIHMSASVCMCKTVPGFSPFFVCLPLSVCLSVCLPVCLSVCLPACRPACPCVCLCSPLSLLSADRHRGRRNFGHQTNRNRPRPVRSVATTQRFDASHLPQY